MDSLLDLDDLVLARIALYLGPYGALRLRATCSRLRAMIRAPRKFNANVNGRFTTTGRAPLGYEPRVRTPCQMWRWARRRGFCEMEAEAIEAGARDVERYLPDIQSAGALRASEIGHDAAIAMWRETFARDEYTRYGCGAWISPHRANQAEHTAILRGDSREIERICSHAIVDPETARLIGKYADDAQVRKAHANGEMYYKFCEAMIGGVIRSGRLELARELIAQRIEIVNGRIISTDAPYSAKCVRDHALSTGCFELCDELEKQFPDIVSDFRTFNAAMRGGIDACVYIRNHCKREMNFGSVIESCEDMKNSAICAFMREWVDFTHESPMIYSSIFTMAVLYALEAGNREVFEYLCEWARASSPEFSLDCGYVLIRAMQRDMYWIADTIVQWNRAAAENPEVIKERLAHPLCDAVIRARLAKMRAVTHAPQQ